MPDTHWTVTGVRLGPSELQAPPSGAVGLHVPPPLLEDEPLLPPLEEPPDPLPDPPPLLLLPEDPPEPPPLLLLPLPLPLPPPDTPLELPLPEEPPELPPEPPSPPRRGAPAPEHASAKDEAIARKKNVLRMTAGITLPWLGRLRY